MHGRKSALLLTLSFELFSSAVSAGQSDAPATRRSTQQRDVQGQTHATAQSDTESSAVFASNDDKIDLNKVDFNGLQKTLDVLASSTCTPTIHVSCRWKVLSLVREQPLKSATGQKAPVAKQNKLTSKLTTAKKPKAPEPALLSALPDPPPEPLEEEKPIKQGQRFSNKVPAGFQKLASLQRKEVDIYIGNKPLLKAAIKFDSSSYTFDEPATVARNLFDLGIADPLELEAFLSLDLPVSADDVCIDKFGPRSCGTREPQPFALIPDLSKSRLDLISRASLRPAQDTTAELLPLPESAFSWQSSAKATATTNSSETSTGDVNGNASVSYGPGGLFVASSYYYCVMKNIDYKKT